MKTSKNIFAFIKCILFLATGFGNTMLYGQTEANAKYCMDIDLEYNMRCSGSYSLDYEVIVSSYLLTPETTSYQRINNSGTRTYHYQVRGKE